MLMIMSELRIFFFRNRLKVVTLDQLIRCGGYKLSVSEEDKLLEEAYNFWREEKQRRGMAAQRHFSDAIPDCEEVDDSDDDLETLFIDS